MNPDDTYYAVFLRGLPIDISIHRHMAEFTAKERSVPGAKATVVALQIAPPEQLTFQFDDPTSPGCSLCAHGGKHE